MTGEVTGVPAGLISAIRTTLVRAPKPIRRRDLLQALEQHGHQVSLAGLNRALDHCLREHLVEQGPEGVRWIGGAS